jgi:hypothetical protein
MSKVKVRLLSSVLIAISLILDSHPASAQSWYDISWPYRCAVTITNSGSTSLTDYQVKITLNNSFDFSNAKSDGSDLRVTSHDGTTLIPFWIENWNAVTQQASIWVKVPMLGVGGTTVYLYYGNPAPTLPSTLAEVPPTGPFTRAAGNPIVPSGTTDTNLLAENIVYDPVTNHYWMCLANYTRRAISLIYSDNPTDPASWVWSGNVITTFTDFFSGAPHLIKEGGIWYMFYSDRPNIMVATASNIAGPYTINPTPVLSPSGPAPAWDNFRVDEPYVLQRPSDNKWILIYMGDARTGGLPVEQIGYAVADNITGPYTAYANNPVLRFGTTGSYDAGTIADPWVYYFQGSYYIGYTVSPTSDSPWSTACATTTDWQTFTKQGVVFPVAQSGWDANNSFRGAVTRIENNYVFSYAGDSYAMGIATQPVYMTASSIINSAEAVFDFFDGFDGTSLNTAKWYFLQGNLSQSSVSDGNLTLTSTSGNYASLMSQSTFGPGYMMECRAQHPQHGTVNMIMEMGFNASFGDLVRIVDDFPSEVIPNCTATWNRQSKLLSQPDTQNWLAMAQSADQNWHTFAIFRQAGVPNTAGYQIDQNPVETTTASVVPGSNLPVFLMSYTESGPNQTIVDWMRVRKYSSVDPTATVGSVEALSGPPMIVQQPVGASVLLGQTATFSVSAIGSLPLGYQWQKNGSNVSGATSASYTTPATVASDSGATFRCMISNNLGSVTSQGALLRVTTSPNVLINGDFESGVTPWTFYSNGSATYSITSPGSPGSSSAAMVNVITEGTNVQLYQFGITLEPSTSYFLRFDAYSNTGHDVDVSLIQHVAPYTNYGLSNHQFTLTNSWQTFSVTFTTSGFSSIVNDGRLMFWLSPYDASGDQYYFDNVVLAKASDLTPKIVTQPVSRTVIAGQTATFSVVAIGLNPLSYQWQKNETDINGATGAAYTTPAAATADSGALYRCHVTNSVGSVFSSDVQLLVYTPRPAIVNVDPRDTTVQEGRGAQFTVQATGSTPITYRWQRNGVDIPGAVAASYAIPACALSDNGAAFRCIAANVDGKDTSNAAHLFVVPAPPVITQQPANRTVLVGETATFSVVAPGSQPLAYQWQRSGTAIPGANNPSYTTPVNTAADSGSTFRCQVSNGVGSATSSSAFLIVNTPAQTTVIVSPVSGSAIPQAQSSVSVVVSNIKKLQAARIVLAFDGTVLRADSIKQGGFPGGSTFFDYTPKPLTAGTSVVTVDQAILGPLGASGSGALLTVYFTALKAGSSALTLQTVDLRDTMNQAISATTVGGSVAVLGLQVNPTVFLEGCYLVASTSLRNSLKTSGILSTHFAGRDIPAYAVDSVNVEIRDSASAAASTIRRFTPAWLLTNGTLRGFTDTTQNGAAFDVPAGNYYVVVRHRNHLAVMSNAAVALSATPASWDFTTAMSAGYGTNPMKVVGGNRFALFAGESNGDGQITSSDFTVFSPRFRTAATGYEISDWNLDGLVTSTDFTIFSPNFRTAAASKVPN